MSASVTPPTPATPATPAPADPFPAGLQRVAALSGAAAGLLILVAFIVNSAETPDFNAPAAEYARFAAEEDSAIKLSSFLLLLGSFLLLFYAGVVRSALGHGEQAARGFTRLAYIVLAGLTFAAAGLALAATTQAMWGASEGSEPEVVKTYANISGAAAAASIMGFAAALDAAGFIILRTRVFPVWLGWVSLVGAFFFLVASLFVLDVADDESIFGIGYPIGFLALLIWLVGTSVLLARRVGAEPVQVHRYE